MIMVKTLGRQERSRRIMVREIQRQNNSTPGLVGRIEHCHGKKLGISFDMCKNISIFATEKLIVQEI